MKKGISISPAVIKKSLLRFLHRFHIIIFVIVVLGGLLVALLLLNEVIAASSSPGDYTPQSNTITFDKETMNRVDELKSRSENSGQLNLPNGRVNPFVE